MRLQNSQKKGGNVGERHRSELRKKEIPLSTKAGSRSLWFIRCVPAQGSSIRNRIAGPAEGQTGSISDAATLRPKCVRQNINWKVRRSQFKSLPRSPTVATDPSENTGRNEMTRSPCVDAACRFFRDVTASPRTARPARLRSRSGWVYRYHVAARWRRTPSKGSPDHIKAVTSAVDDAAIKAKARRRRTGRLSGSTTPRPASASWTRSRRERKESRADVDLQPRIDPRRRGDAARRRRHHVCVGVMECRARHRCAHRQADLDLRSRSVAREGGYKGCCDVVNRGVALYKGKVYVGPMMAGWSRSTRLPARRSGKRTPSSTAANPTPSPARRASSRARC